MIADGQSADWIQRLQSVANETVRRSTASAADLQRLLAGVAVSGVSQEALAAEVSRFGEEHGAEAYQSITELGARFISCSLRLVASHHDEYLRSLLPPDRVAVVGVPPPTPAVPTTNGIVDWAAWYQRYAGWVTEQQAWSARLYRALADELAAGQMKPDAFQVAAGTFLEAHLPPFLADMAELNADLVGDLLSLADGSVAALSETLLGAPSDELLLELHGTAGTIATAVLVVDNERAEPSTVECLITPVDGFVLVTAPMQFVIGAGESRSVAVHVTLPADPTGGPRPAGRISIRGHGDRDLVVQVQADARAAADQAVGPTSVTPGTAT